MPGTIFHINNRLGAVRRGRYDLQRSRAGALQREKRFTTSLSSLKIPFKAFRARMGSGLRLRGLRVNGLGQDWGGLKGIILSLTDGVTTFSALDQGRHHVSASLSFPKP